MYDGMGTKVVNPADHEKRIAQLEGLLAQQATFNAKLLDILIQLKAALAPEAQSAIHMPKLIGIRKPN